MLACYKRNMQSLTRWLILLFTLTMLACGDDGSSGEATIDAAAIDAATIDGASGGACEGSPPAGCEETVDNVDDCPSLDDVCDGVCGAAYECCYCNDDGTWGTLNIDCPACPDAGGIDAL